MQDKEFEDIYDKYKDTSGEKEITSSFGMLMKEKLEDANAALNLQKKEEVNAGDEEPEAADSNNTPDEEEPETDDSNNTPDEGEESPEDSQPSQ
jgi:hypothetical protein